MVVSKSFIIDCGIRWKIRPLRRETTLYAMVLYGQLQASFVPRRATWARRAKGHYGPLWDSTGLFMPRLTSSGVYRPLQATLGFYGPPRPTTGFYGPRSSGLYGQLQASLAHFGPLRAISDLNQLYLRLLEAISSALWLFLSPLLPMPPVLPVGGFCVEGLALCYSLGYFSWWPLCFGQCLEL
jgi:hypothetical protein